VNYQAYNYYIQDTVGLFNIAHSGAGGPVVQPKSTNTRAILFKGKFYSSSDEIARLLQMLPLTKLTDADTLIWEDPPVCTLKYPLGIGKEWNYRSQPFRMGKKVVDRIQLSRNGKIYDCYQIKWLYDMDYNNEWDEDVYILDYVSKEGLIERTVTITGIYFTDINFEIIGSADYSDQFELIDIKTGPLKIPENLPLAY
jgi:hypothetical protein